MSEKLPATTSNMGNKLLGRLGERYGIEAGKLLGVLRKTVFKVKKGDPEFSDEEMAAALILADKYKLDPFCKEIYLTRAHGKLLVIVPIDGWAKIVNREPTYEGCEFEWIEDESGKLKACRCTIHRSDRKYPVVVEEFLDECYAPKSDSPSDPWRKWKRRMLRHKAFNQGARLAYAIGGVADESEAEAARYVEVKELSSRQPRTMTLPQPESSRGVTMTAEAERQTRTWSGEDQKQPEPEPQGEGPQQAETAPVDPERAGLKRSFQELWKAHVAQGNDPAGLFGVTDEAGDTLTTEDLLDLNTIMGEQLEEVKA